MRIYTHIIIIRRLSTVTSFVRALLCARIVSLDAAIHAAGVSAATNGVGGSSIQARLSSSSSSSVGGGGQHRASTNLFTGSQKARLHNKANPFNMDASENVFGQRLEQCGVQPVTGFFRDGFCNTSPADTGSHTVAAIVSDKWLDFSAARGNDLRGFLTGGCRWCLCASRWKESFDAFRRGELDRDAVPQVILAATHKRSLDKVTLQDLQGFSHHTPAAAAFGSNHPSQGGPIR